MTNTTNTHRADYYAPASHAHALTYAALAHTHANQVGSAQHQIPITGATPFTPVWTTIAEQRLVGRITGGNVGELTSAQVHTLLGLGTMATATATDYLAKAIVDVKGDLLIASAADTVARYALAVPAANVRNLLSVDNGEDTPTWKPIFNAVNPATLTVSAAAASGTALAAAHRDHVHPITSSSNPGTAAAILATDAAGFITVAGADITSYGSGLRVRGGVASFDVGTAHDAYPLAANCYIGGTPSNWRYRASDYAALMASLSGDFEFYTAASGTAGDLISLSLVMTILNGGAIEMPEITAPAAGAANTVRIYAEDDGAGKTRLMAKFSSGAAQQLAIQP